MMFRLAHNLTKESRRKLRRLNVDSFSSQIKHEITLQHQFREKIRELEHVFFNYSGNKKNKNDNYNVLTSAALPFPEKANEQRNQSLCCINSFPSKISTYGEFFW